MNSFEHIIKCELGESLEKRHDTWGMYSGRIKGSEEEWDYMDPVDSNSADLRDTWWILNLVRSLLTSKVTHQSEKGV